MEVAVETAATRCAKLQSNHLHQQTNTQFFTGWMTFLSPNQQCHITEGKTMQQWEQLAAEPETCCLFIQTVFHAQHGLGQDPKVFIINQVE